MTGVARWVLVAVLGASALAKGVDVQGAGAVLATNLGLSLPVGAVLAAALVLAEGAACLLLVRGGRRAYQLATGLLVFFLGGSLTGALLGWASCGCFGSVLAVPPWVTVGKNVVLLALGGALLAGSGSVGGPGGRIPGAPPTPAGTRGPVPPGPPGR